MTSSPNEMPIPKSAVEVTFQFCGGLFVVGVSVLAVWTLFQAFGDQLFGVGFIAASLWLLIAASVVCFEMKEQRGFRRWARNFAGRLMGRPFVKVSPEGEREIQFGFRMFGRTYLDRTVAVADIESVEWNSGQGTEMAGRDMDDWHVCLWYDHRDEKKTERQANFRKPGQEIIVIGPSGPKPKAAALGLEFLELLKRAGADLRQSESPERFERSSNSQARNL